MDLNLILGTLGAVIILAAFLLNEAQKLRSDDVVYDAMNAIGSVFLVVYAINLNSIPFIIVNVIWGLFSFKDVILHFLKK